MFSTGVFAQNNETGGTFTDGESLKYVMHYGWIDGGYASLKLKEETYEGKDVYHVEAIGATSGITDMVYNVHDVYESYFDRETLLPYKAIRNIKEGKYRSYNEVYYNHEAEKLESMRSGVHVFPDSLPKQVFDLVSAFYLLRKRNFEDINEGDLITINTYFSDEFWLLQVRYMGTKVIRTRLGKFECMEFRPVVEPGRVFDTEDDVKVYMSKDKNFIPIRVQMDIIVGSFKGDLVEYSGLKHELKNLKK